MLPLHGIAEPAPGSEKQIQEQQYHHEADALHDLDVQPGAGETSEIEEHHAIAAGEQENDARPHPWEETAEDAVPEPKPRLGLERPRRLAQHHIGEEYAAHPHHDGTWRAMRSATRRGYHMTSAVSGLGQTL